MRFDPERVLALARGWPSPRPPRSEGERRAADEIAGHFERAGLFVERVASGSLNTSPLMVFIPLAFYAWMLPAVALPGASTTLRCGLTGLILFALFVAFRWVVRRDRAEGLTDRPHHVLGKPSSEGRPPARVVLVTLLTTPTSRRAHLGRWPLLGVFTALGVIGLTPWFQRAVRSSPSLGLLLLLVQWITMVVLMLVVPNRRAARPVQGDNRTGLAFLAELARTWPERLSGRVEIWFVATSNPFALATELRRQSDPSRPTLVLWLHAPGVGDDITITGRGPAARLARTAARDLWLPHRSNLGLASALTWQHIYRTYDLSCISLRGAFDDRPSNPAILAATAQLVTEIALRWTKQASGRVSHPAGATSPAPGRARRHS